MLVLVIDDEFATLYLGQRWFEAMVGTESTTVQLVTAQHGDEGLRYAQVSRPDVIISDYDMPVMNGFELWQALRADDVLRSVPFMFTSSSIEPSCAVTRHHAEMEEVRQDLKSQLLSKTKIGRRYIQEMLERIVEYRGNILP